VILPKAALDFRFLVRLCILEDVCVPIELGTLVGRWYNPLMSPRERVYRTEAVVLRRQNLGEADRILILYSPNRGKLRAIAKGVRRPRSRKAGHLEPFTRVQLMLASGRELDIITQAEALDTFPALRDDLVRLGQAAYVVEVLDRLTVDREDNIALYRLLVNTLRRMESGVDANTVLRYFEVRILELSGYRPEVFHCVGCSNEVKPEDQFFSSSEGGVLCQNCGPTRSGIHTISLGALKVLRHYLRNTFAAASTVSIRPEVYAELEEIMEDYLIFVLERKLNSPVFLKRVRRMAQNENEGQAVS
jgi:DNA repair protein RecO (recombination protein O)